MTDPYRLTPAPAPAPGAASAPAAAVSPTGAATRSPSPRPGALRVLLWALLTVSVVGNTTVSTGVGPSWLSIALGVLTAVCATALLGLHLRHR